jgi:hypothetical protein
MDITVKTTKDECRSMEYNRALELIVLKFLRVRIGQQFTPDELFEEVSKMCLTTKEQFSTLLKILQVEELIEVSSAVGDTTVEVIKVIGITKEGLQLLRSKKQ